MSGLSQNDKLRALGLKRESSQKNTEKGLFEQLREAVEWEDYRDDFSGFDDLDDFQDYLEDDAEFSEEDAERFRDRLDGKYDEFDDAKTDVEESDSYDEWEGEFRFGTTLEGDTIDEEGDNNAGIKIHGEGGISQAGVQVPAGTVEIYGPRIEFSQTEPTIEDPESVFEVTNLQVSNTLPTVNEFITISADIENQSGYSTDFTAKLLEDGENVVSRTLSFEVDETRTVEFVRSYSEYETFEVQINDSDTDLISVVHSGITGIQ